MERYYPDFQTVKSRYFIIINIIIIIILFFFIMYYSNSIEQVIPSHELDNVNIGHQAGERQKERE